MKRIAAVVGVVALGITAGGAAALQRPDFSGEWAQDIETPAGRRGGGGGGGQRGGGQRGTPGDLGSGWGRTLSVMQNESMLTVQYEFFVRGDLQPPMKFVYALDGTERSTNVMLGRGIQRQTSRTTWQADTLVITTLHDVNEPDLPAGTRVQTRRRLWLASPDSLVVETTRSGVPGGAPNLTRTVYRK